MEQRIEQHGNRNGVQQQQGNHSESANDSAGEQKAPGCLSNTGKGRAV